MIDHEKPGPGSLAGIGVTTALNRVIEQNPARLESLTAEIHHWLAQYKKGKVECPDGASVVHAFQLAMDKLVEKAAEKQIVSCSRGCSHCCYIEVHITPDEADLLLMMAEQHDIAIDWEKLKHQAKVTRWNQLDYKARACVFLGDQGECRVYDYRPMSCRKYMVASPPEKCNSEKYPAGKTILLTANHAEAMASAIFSASGTDMLPKQLLTRKETK